MDTTQNYVIRHNVIKESLNELRKRQSYVDVTLVSDEGLQMYAHRIILAAGSHFFEEIFPVSTQQAAYLYLKGVKSKELKSIVEFLYNGETSIEQDELTSFIRTAKELKIKGIQENEVIKEEINPLSNTFNLLVDSDPTERFKADINPTVKAENIVKDESHAEYLQERQIYEGDNHLENEEIGVRSSYSKTKKFIVRKRELLKCQHCEYTANRPNRLKMHTEFVHMGIKYSCTLCEYETKAESYLKQHMQTIHEGIRYPCENCEFQGGSMKKLSIHIRSKHESELYSCDKCEHKVPFKEHLQRHQQAVHENIGYPCNQCDYQATVRHYLKAHIQNIHEGNKNFSCDQCDYKSGNKSSVWMHKQKHNEVVSEKGVCTLCGHILKNPKYLNHHMKTVHGNPKYFCEVCPYKCTSNTNLKRHINLKHNKDKEIILEVTDSC